MIAGNRTVLTLAAVAMAIFGLTIPLANAKLVLEEQFVYEPPEANIDTQNGGTGFDGPWVSTISHGRIYWIRSPGLSFSTLPVAGNALSRYGSSGRAQAHRLLSSESKAALTRDNTTIWFGVLFQEPVNQYKHGSFLFGTYHFSTQGVPALGDGDADRNPPFTPVNGDGFGFTIQSAPAGSSQGTGTINALAFDNSSAPIVVEGTFTPDPIDATVLIVGKINWKANGTPDELFLFNVTDLSREPTEGEAIVSITNLDFDQSAFDRIAMWDSNNAITDEIRFGTSFANVMGAVDKASSPNPADDTMLESTSATLSWRAGNFAVSHNVYFGDNFDDVNQATPEDDAFMGNQSEAVFSVEDLTPGATYCWRLDEVNDLDPNSPWKGDVWSFRVRPLTAWNPAPADGIQYVHPDQELTWEHGLGCIFHKVFFGETFEEVESATGMSYMTVEPTYDPPTLEIGKTYYWRVDEFAGTMEHRGDIWSFTTIPDVAVTDPDLLGWWTLDEGMGTTAVDWSGHGHHGRILGSAEWTYGVQDGALYLAGGANVEIPALNVETNTVTMTAWVKRNGSQADWAGVLFSREGSEVSGMGFGPANELRYHWTDQYWDFATGLVAPNQEWFFMALVVEPTQGTLYYNGTGTFARNEAAHDPDPFDGALRIGQDSQGGRDLKGTVDDVRFYNKALSAAEIMEVMRGDPLLAWDPTPAPDAVMDIRDVSSLRWSAGDTVASHDVYFGASREAVAAAGRDSAEFQGSQTASSFSLGDLVEIGGGDCYWRIDEVEGDGVTVHTGYVWKFTVLPYLIVDNFESYNDEENQGTRIYETWADGWANAVYGGSQVGYTDPPFAEQTTVYGGAQSMPLQYDNTTGPGYSEADRTFSPAQDWTVEGVTTLVVHFRGLPDNAGQLYVKINGTNVPYDGDPADIATARWFIWDIDLASVGTNLKKVTTLTIGIEGGETGVLYIDEIVLTKP